VVGLTIVKAYRELTDRFRRMLVLRSVEDIMDWDTAVMMPTSAMEARSEQLALLRVMQHEQLADPSTAALLDEAESRADGLADWDRANLAEMRRMWVHGASVPKDLVEALSRATSACEVRWRSARPASDFSGVAPLLSEVLRLIREVAEARVELLGATPYEALLDEHDPGVRCADIDPLFDELAELLPGLIERALETQARRGPARPLEGPFDAEAQRRLGLELMQRVGFDPEQGRLDVSHHPFCGGTPDDVRITTRYDEDDFASGLMGVLHETGHALYQRGLPSEWRHQPVGEARGMGLHESQSLLIEMQACRSRPFIAQLAPRARRAFGREGDAWSEDNLIRHYRQVTPDFIRVDADEVTYPAHVILRYRLEKAMIAGELTVEDLPGAWSEGMKDLLGLDVPDHRRGCLQDIHWFSGAFGYFPSYTLGAMMAAQLFRTAQRRESAIDDGLERGDFGPLLDWLREHVHRHGSRYSTPELIERATGSGLDIRHYREHLEERYVDAV
jgi:carboxypeptidase Taq